MVLDILKQSEQTWRDIVRLARPIDADKKVILGSDPKKPNDFEAYTDNVKIYINVNQPKKFEDNFKNIVIPAYKIAATKLYDVPNNVTDLELLKNIIFDNFLFIHFHEQFHPMLCPNSREDEKTINKYLFEGIKEAEPSLSKADAMIKVNNCKNLIWDTILNINFINKTIGYDNDILADKISFVFQRDNREIEFQPVSKYPSGILPSVYMISAATNRTDIAISLIGALYSSMSYNDKRVRKNAMKIFTDDLNKKKVNQPLDVLVDMYKGFISELDPADLKGHNIKINEYNQRLNDITNLTHRDYEDNQKYFVETLCTIFDTHMRYDSLKGFIKVLSQYLSLSQKQGSPDQNTGSGGGGSGDDSDEENEDDESDEDSDGSGGGSGDEEDDEDDLGEGGSGKSQEEMDEDSMADTMDDILDGMDEKDANDILGDVANGNAGYGRGIGAPNASRNILKTMSVIAADEFYKRNADTIEVRNPSEETFSQDVGNKKVWKLVRSTTLTAAQVAKMNLKNVFAFQQKTGLPILMQTGPGYYKNNEYKIVETPLKSYQSELTGIEVPDNWVFIQDSSGSMTGSTFVGSGNPFDLLNRVKYGLKNGLYEICKTMGKDLKFGVVDFSDRTIYSKLDSLIKIYDTKNHPVKKVSLIPQCGGTYCNPKVFDQIQRDLNPGTTVYTMVTDGGISGSIQLFNKISQVVKNPQTAFVFIEVGLTTSLGNSIEQLSRTYPSVQYYSVNSIKAIKDKLESVLITYN
ncbi:hypothetical protein ACFL1H_06020 [Nanoarchaeota archaeon]